MYKSAIEKLYAIQEGRLGIVKLQKNQRLSLSDGPPTKRDGLYWIYTTYSNEELHAATPSSKRDSVDFSSLVKFHAGLKNLCTCEVDGFRVVYNGIGGCGPKGSGGLRERILQEFRGGEGTGALAIKDSSLNDLEKWRYSYVLWSEVKEILCSPFEYGHDSKTLERIWRIHYGWPILCRE